MWFSLRTGKQARSWETLAGYTTQDLREHIEKLFVGGMTWDRFLAGEIHIDHKAPISSFSFSRASDADFKRCWALDNLQPLWAIDNLVKGDKVVMPFEPALMMGGFQNAARQKAVADSVETVARNVGAIT
jgi:hypothetical protein